MKKVLRIAMWIVLGIIGLIAVIAIIVYNWQSITNFKIGRIMNEYTEITTQWMDIDFTTAVKGETAAVVWNDQNKTSPALEKYAINGIFGIKNIILVYGSNYPEMQSINLSNNLKAHLSNQQNDNADIYFEDKNEQAYIFRSTDDGKTFEKISLGHGAAGYQEDMLDPIYANDSLYIGAQEGDTQKIHYYRSEDLGKTWQKNNWKPTTVWKDGTLFIGESKSSQDGANVQMSKDDGKTWYHINGELKSFYNKTHSLWQLDDHTLVGMTEGKKILFLDLTTMQEKNYPLSLPKGKVTGGFGVSNSAEGKNEFYLELYDDLKDPNNKHTYLNTQESLWFPMSDEHVEITKKIPKIFFHVTQKYIGGMFNYGDETLGTPVHVYTLDRGKHWKFEILEPYRLILTSAYIDGQFWFIGNKNPNADVFLTKRRIK